MRVLGVDACKDGWVGIDLDSSMRVRATWASTIQDLVEEVGPVAVVAVDIPIGLPTSGSRAADRLARKAVGPRAPSVFTTPPRAVLEAATHAEANALCRELCGCGVSQQAFALGPKILSVDAWTRRTDVRVVEVHPEVSFATLAGRQLPEPKSTWSGFMLRIRLLADAGITVEDAEDLAGHRVAPDDVLDAAVAAWTASRVARGISSTLPDPPERLPDQRVAAIWA